MDLIDPRYHGRATAINNQRISVHKTMAVHKPKAAAARGGAANQKGIAAGLGKTGGSTSAKQ